MDKVSLHPKGTGKPPSYSRIPGASIPRPNIPLFVAVFEGCGGVGSGQEISGENIVRGE